MDDDEAFLYSEDVPETTGEVGKPAGGQSVQPAVEPTAPLNLPGKPISPVPATIPTTTEQVHRAFELASNALIPPEPLPILLPSHPVEPATAPVTQAQATIDEHSQNQSINIDGTGMVDEEDEEEEVEEVGDKQGLLEDSDEVWSIKSRHLAQLTRLLHAFFFGGKINQ
ncbi:cleavage polyadenylation factor subunit fip1 [Puccinia graminis f. sp. tritici]|nr:cleavage polyadenylation factor subunit fip1 [Puccinia graminis f. sp. tritici]